MEGPPALTLSLTKSSQRLNHDCRPKYGTQPRYLVEPREFMLTVIAPFIDCSQIFWRRK
jgi:hypothetical protein